MKPVPQLFQGLNDVDLYTARRRFRERALAPGERVIAAGEPAEGVVIVVEGRLEVVRDGVVIGSAGPNDLVGETGLFDTGFRGADVVAAEPSHILELDRAGYEELRDTVHPAAAELERRTLINQVGRLRAVGDRIAELSDGRVRTPVPPSERFFGAVSAMFGPGGSFSSRPIDALITLRQSPAFADAPDEALAGIAPYLHATAYGPGALLCTEGQPGDTMFLIHEGQVEVIVAVEGDRVQALATLGPGAAFGMVALAEGGVRMCSCLAKDQVVAQSLDRTGYTALMNDGTWAGTIFRRGLISMLLQQLAAANAQLAQFQEKRSTDLGPLRRATIAREVVEGPT